jgi:predicted transcriptional regulator
MKYRDRHEITAQILEIANGNGVRLSKIMYDGYLSHTATKEYLGILIENGLIEYLGERTFKTTEKGMNFLRIHNRVQELTPPTTNLHKREEMVSYL